MVPFLLLALLAAVQLGLAGHSLWSAGVAARAGARATLVGSDAAAAARQALPPSLRKAAEVESGSEVSVRVPVPRFLPGMPRLTVASSTDLEAGDG